MDTRTETRRREREGGFTLLEVAMASVILVISSTAMVAGLMSSSVAEQGSTRRLTAIEAVLSMADEIRATPMASVATAFNGTFSIPGLDDENEAGRVYVITDETVTDADLPLAVGMPRDLDGDGEASSTNVSTSAVVLLVIIEASWGPEGRREFFRIPVTLIR